MFFKRFRVNFKSQISTGFYHFPLVSFINIGKQMLVKFFLPSSSLPGFHLLDSLLSVINHDFSYSHIHCQRKATKAAAKITPIMAQIDLAICCQACLPTCQPIPVTALLTLSCCLMLCSPVTAGPQVGWIPSISECCWINFEARHFSRHV